MYKQRQFLAAGVLAALLTIGISQTTLASQRSSELIDAGVAELQKSEWNNALRQFVAASIADPKDAEAKFFQGVALNRLALHEEALAQIESARAAGVQNKSMDFEYGWALLGTGRFEQARTALQAYKSANPDSAKASELIGRAELSLGNEAAGQKAFDEAERLDPSLASSIAFFRAGLAQAKGEALAGAELLDSAASADQAGPVSRAVRQHLSVIEAVRVRRRDKPWAVFGSASFGRSSNVVALSDEIARPADITRKGSKYFDVTAGGQYRLDINADQAVTIGSVLNRRNYRDLSGNDTDTFNLFTRYEHPVNRRVRASVAGSFTHVRVDGDQKQNTVTLSPRVDYQINELVRFNASYTASKVNLPEPTATPGTLDRDSHLQSFGGGFNIAFPKLRSEVSFGARILNNSAVGSDYDYSARNLTFGVRTRLPYQITGGLSLNTTRYDYKNLNSLAPTTPPTATAFGFARQDTITTYSLNLSRPINDRVSVFLRASATRANSNLAVFTYRQNDTQIGVLARF